MEQDKHFKFQFSYHLSSFFPLLVSISFSTNQKLPVRMCLSECGLSSHLKAFSKHYSERNHVSAAVECTGPLMSRFERGDRRSLLASYSAAGSDLCREGGRRVTVKLLSKKIIIAEAWMAADRMACERPQNRS